MLYISVIPQQGMNMGHVPLCDWCGEHEVGSIDGGHLHYCSDDCAECASFEEWNPAAIEEDLAALEQLDPEICAD